MAKSKVLLVIDPQYDFINGSLRINDAKEKMDALTNYLSTTNNEYKSIIFTCDWHPMNHCSFGEWPVHCVQHTVGASIYEPLFNVANAKTNTIVFTKGDNAEKEEYSIMQNDKSCLALLKLLNDDEVDEIHVAGIVDMFCVKNTIIDLMAHGLTDKLKVLSQYVSNFNNEVEFLSFLQENNVKFVVG